MTRGSFHAGFPVPEKQVTLETPVFGEHPKEAPQLLAEPAPSACVVPCPSGSTDPLAAALVF